MLTINPPGLPHVFPFCLWIVSPRGPVTFMVRCFSLLNGSGLISPLIALWFVLTCLFPVCQTVRNLRAGTTFYSCLHLCLFRDPCKARHRVCAWMSTPPPFFFFFLQTGFMPEWGSEWKSHVLPSLQRWGLAAEKGVSQGVNQSLFPGSADISKAQSRAEKTPHSRELPHPQLTSWVAQCGPAGYCVYVCTCMHM